MPLRTPGYWRDRAEEARVEMESMRDPDARRMMQAVIKHCEEVAALMEKLAAKGILLPREK